MADAFDSETVTALDDWTPFFDQLSGAWTEAGGSAASTVADYLAGAHRRELEAASQKPVVNVTVEGVPGHVSADTGTGEMTYSPEPAPEPPCT
jgi:hypothetical protein